MKRRMNPLAVIALVIMAGAAFVLAFFIKGLLPSAIGKWSGFIFWWTVILIAGGGALLIGKFINKMISRNLES